MGVIYIINWIEKLKSGLFALFQGLLYYEWLLSCLLERCEKWVFLLLLLAILEINSVDESRPCFEKLWFLWTLLFAFYHLRQFGFSFEIHAAFLFCFASSCIELRVGPLLPDINHCHYIKPSRSLFLCLLLYHLSKAFVVWRTQIILSPPLLLATIAQPWKLQLINSLWRRLRFILHHVNMPLCFRRLFNPIHVCLHGLHHNVLLQMLIHIRVVLFRFIQDGLRLRPLGPTKATWRRPKERWSYIHYDW